MDNTQNSSQFALVNFQRVEIPFGSSNGPLTNGYYFAQYEGSSIYVERCDYPCLFTFSNQQSSAEQSIVMREGQEYSTPFKGFTITAPFTASSASLTIIICKNGATYTNQLASPLARLGPSVRVVGADIGTAEVRGIFVPKGVRALDNVTVNAGNFLTFTSCFATFVDAAGLQIVGPAQSQFVGATPGNYAGSAQQFGVIQGAIASFPKLVVPSLCVEIQITLVGTGLTPSPNIYGNWE